MASAYLFHICQNHPFNDGNKRTGLVSTITFFILNGIEIDGTNDAYDLVISVIEGNKNKNDIAKYFKSREK